MTNIETVEKNIMEGCKKGLKNYAFDHIHDENTPADYWFQESTEGLTLFVVFYTQACQWSQCLGCNLPSKMSKIHISFKSIMNQVDSLFEIPNVKSHLKDIKKVIVSNNGSVLDEDTFSSTALMYFLAKANMHLPVLSVLALETRPEYIDLSELEFIHRALQEGDTPTELEICIGFEAYDPVIRNNYFKKGLSLDTFEDMVEKLARYDFRLKCYFMIKPVPGMTDDEGVNDIHQAFDYLDKISKRTGLRINMHLNPTFVARGTELEQAFMRNEYSPPLLIDTARAAVYAESKRISVYLGLSDEGLAIENGSFIRPEEQHLVEQLEEFNRTENYSILKNILKK